MKKNFDVVILAVAVETWCVSCDIFTRSMPLGNAPVLSAQQRAQWGALERHQSHLARYGPSPEVALYQFVEYYSPATPITAPLAAATYVLTSHY